jgi:hypothetical protein
LSKIISGFGSDAWLSDVKELCFNFYKYIKQYPGGDYLYFKDEIGDKNKPGKIVKEYHKSANKLKLEIFGDNAKDKLIDYHKIGSLYIRSFLKVMPFYIKIPKIIKEPQISMYIKSANEFFVIAYLEALFKAWNFIDGELRMTNAYRESFIMQLYQYSKDITKLDPTSFSGKIYLIEKLFFK